MQVKQSDKLLTFLFSLSRFLHEGTNSTNTTVAPTSVLSLGKYFILF